MDGWIRSGKVARWMWTRRSCACTMAAMGSLRLVLKEILHRKLNFALSLLGIIAAVTLFVFFFTAADASRRETARVMRNLGMNLRIIPKDTDMGRFWVTGFSERTLPDGSAKTLAARSGLNYSHLLPTLKRRVEWQGREVIVVGIAEEVSPVDHRMPNMSYVIQRGTVFVGRSLVEQFDLEKGQSIDLLGKSFRVAACLAESGTDQDVSILGHLSDVQALLGMEGLINEIQALDCVCLDPTKDSLEVLREQLASVLPEAQVIQVRTLAGVREAQRRLVEDSIAIALPFVIVIAALWVGVLAWINVRERWREIGILRALGHGSWKISALFLVKAFVIGIIGAVVGYAAGTWLALEYGPGVFKLTGKGLAPMGELLGWALLAAPVFAAVSSLVPTAVAVAQDPAVALREDSP